MHGVSSTGGATVAAPIILRHRRIRAMTETLLTLLKASAGALILTIGMGSTPADFTYLASLFAFGPARGSAIDARGAGGEAAAWSARFAAEVDRRLDVPPNDQQRYAVMLAQALAQAGVSDRGAQAFVLIDRSPQVQAGFVVLRTPAGGWHWLGAAPVSTGRPSGFEHFRTPTGVFAHTLDNPDFRAEGTLNEHNVRGYGLAGMRVFDFGWVAAERGWGRGGTSLMRLQMHATDPDRLEPRLGRAESKGCIRIPATLNTFLDRHGILDADYDAALARGDVLWVLRADREPIPWPGRYLVVVDSQAATRP
ncbi:MAG TPA: L,D-transpeptidase, partial [Methylomirabilota bacterium]|nr:L,D-transpeptidase [Methylomirabilota bacterium]